MAAKNILKKVVASMEAGFGKDACSGSKNCCEEECKEKVSCTSGCHDSHPCRRLGKVVLKTLWGIFLVYLIVYVGSLARNNIKKFYYIGKMDRPQNTISITGEGKVTVTPNIATIDVGLTTDKADVALAQKENTGKMNALISNIKALGIAEADIQTSQYQIFPKYDYTNGKSVLSGYTVSQSLTLKIRDLSKINAVLQKTGESGANQVGGLQFTVDDIALVQQQARVKALAQAQEKASMLASELGVNLVRVVSFNEYAPQGGPMPMFARGLGVSEDGYESAPSIQPGSNEVRVNVNVIYEID